jgi:hypothetical protein
MAMRQGKAMFHSSSMQVEPIKRKHSWWQRLVPIRTTEHAMWAAVIGSIAFLGGGVLTDWNHHFEIALCAIAGTLPGFASNLPANLKVEWSLEGFKPIQNIESALFQAGWSRDRNRRDELRFVQRLPRWLRWKSGEITIETGAFHFVVHGPVLGLSLLRRNLLSGRGSASQETPFR